MKKIIPSIVSMIMTCMLLIFSVFAWYTSNNEVSASGIIASTGSDNVEYKLEMYVESNWIEQTQNIQLGSLSPNDIFYFRLTANPLDSSKKIFSAKFDDIICTISDSLILKDNSIYYYVDDDTDILLYNIVDNKVNVTVDETTKSLYNITDDQIQLADFLIKDAMVLYVWKENEEFSTESLPSTKLILDDYIIKDREVNSTPVEIYFAIEFNNEKSIIGDYESNLFEFQEISIGSIRIINKDGDSIE